MRRLIAGSVLGAVVACGAGAVAAEDQPPYPHTLYAIVKSVKPGELVVQRRDGRSVVVDISLARRSGRTGVLFANRSVALHGDYDGAHVFHAVSITGAAGVKYTPATWPQDE